jgi:hypothetical protein
MRNGNLALVLAGAMLAAAQAHSQTQAHSETQTHSETKILGPYIHDNLSIFLIQQTGATTPGTSHYLTLQSAMEQKKVAVYETKQVNQLAIENTSAESVFLQEGDIVKGGNQDRMITNDFILPPKSGRLTLAAFCVEQGRWSKRGNESAQVFGGSTELGAVRFDPKAMWSQMSVWNKVSSIQGALARQFQTGSANRATGLAGVAEVRSPASPASPTSLMLTQTSPPVEDAAAAYTRTLSGVAAGRIGVTGYAFAVNGDVKGADVYASPELFAAMWPKLLKSSALEALRLRGQGKPVPVEIARVQAFLREAGSGPETTLEVNRRVKLVKRETDRQLLVESREGAAWVHRSVIKK